MKFLLLTSLLVLVSCGSKKEQSKKIDYSVAVSKMVSAIESELDTTDFHTLSDSARVAVHKYTSHSGDEFTCDGPTCVEEMANAVTDTVLNNAEELKTLCSHRARLVMVILEHYGFESRRVNIVNRFDQGHVFLEAKNPNGGWEVIDPDYNVYFVKNSDGSRLSLKELILMDYSDFLPCSEAGCDWSGVYAKEGSHVKQLVDTEYYGVGYIMNVESYTNASKFGAPIDFRWVKDRAFVWKNFNK